jgi:hypothetical protein
MTLSATSFRTQLLNGLIFVSGLLGFLIAVALRNNDLGLSIAFIVVALNLILISRRQRIDLMKSITCLSLGFFFEYLNMSLRLFNYEFTPEIPPVWMLGLWPVISTLFFAALKNLSAVSWWKILICGLPIGSVHWMVSHFGRIQFFEPEALTFSALTVVGAFEFLLVAFICKKLDARPEVSRPKT